MMEVDGWSHMHNGLTKNISKVFRAQQKPQKLEGLLHKINIIIITKSGTYIPREMSFTNEPFKNIAFNWKPIGQCNG